MGLAMKPTERTSVNYSISEVSTVSLPAGGLLRSQASAPDSNASRRRTPGATLRCSRAGDPAPPGSLGSVPFDRRNGGPPGLPRHRAVGCPISRHAAYRRLSPAGSPTPLALPRSRLEHRARYPVRGATGSLPLALLPGRDAAIGNRSAPASPPIHLPAVQTSRALRPDIGPSRQGGRVHHAVESRAVLPSEQGCTRSLTRRFDAKTNR